MASKSDQYLNFYHKSLFNTIYTFISVKGEYDADELVGLSGEIMIANTDTNDKFMIIDKKRIIYEKDLVSTLENGYSDMFEHLISIAETDINMFYLNKYYINGINKPYEVDLRYKFILTGISLSTLDFLKGYILLPKGNIEKHFNDSQSEELKKYVKKVYKHKGCVSIEKLL